MAATTISISTHTRAKLKEFGMKGESYDDIINKLYQSACKRQLYDILFNEDDSMNLDEAREFILKDD